MTKVIKVDAYHCEKCGLIWYHKHAAETCCRVYHCDTCGKETPKYHTRCYSCKDKVAFEKATKVTLEEYKKKHPDFPVVFGDDHFAFESADAIIDMAAERGVSYAWVAEADPIQLDEKEAVERIDEDAGLDYNVISDEGYVAYAEFVRGWNAKYGTCVYRTDTEVAVLIPEKREGDHD